MYEDSWYTIGPEQQAKKDDGHLQKPGHRRRESLLKQPNDNGHGIADRTDPLGSLYEEQSFAKGPPKATLARRAKSYSDFYHVARAQLTRDSKKLRLKESEPFAFRDSVSPGVKFERQYQWIENGLLEASQEEYQLYREQLSLSERHLDGLLEDTSSALDLLATLSDSFKAVETQTTAFRAQCEDLLAEQKHLKNLADEIGTDLQYYSYLEPITRRLNAPGALRTLGDDSLVEILTNLDACLDFIMSHPEHRESETYLTRYQSLLQRALNLVHVKFTNALQEKIIEASKHISGGKLTMTTLYIVQAPQDPPIGTELEACMRLIITQAGKLLESSNKGQTSGTFLDNQESRDGRNVYHALFGEMMSEYIVSRRRLVAPLAENLVRDILINYKDENDVSKCAHECLYSVLEICVNEHSKYCLFSLPSPGSMQFKDKLNILKFYQRSNEFNAFLTELCESTATLLEPPLQRVDIPTAIALVLWLDSRYDNSSHVIEDNSSEEPTSNHENEDTSGNDPESSSEVKVRLARHIKVKITTVIFSRMKEVLLKKIERYDARHAFSTPKLGATGANSGENENHHDEAITDAEVEARAQQALGPGLSNAYAPVKTAVQLLTYYNDLTFDSKDEEGMGEMAYQILHETCKAVIDGARYFSNLPKNTPIDGRMFAIKNLVLLKNIVLAYEISGSRRAAALDFTRMWTTFSDFRNRGGFLDVRAYYNLLSSGKLLPEVVTNVEDARVELDGLLRAEITHFREECAAMLWNKKSKGPAKDAWKSKDKLVAKLAVVFPHEQQLRDNLLAAVDESVEDMKRQT